MDLGRSSDTGMPVSGYVKPGSPALVARCPADTGMDGWSQSVMALPIPDAGSPPGTQHAALAGRSGGRWRCRPRTRRANGGYVSKVGLYRTRAAPSAARNGYAGSPRGHWDSSGTGARRQLRVPGQQLQRGGVRLLPMALLAGTP